MTYVPARSRRRVFFFIFGRTSLDRGVFASWCLGSTNLDLILSGSSRRIDASIL